MRRFILFILSFIFGTASAATVCSIGQSEMESCVKQCARTSSVCREDAAAAAEIAAIKAAAEPAVKVDAAQASIMDTKIQSLKSIVPTGYSPSYSDGSRQWSVSGCDGKNIAGNMTCSPVTAIATGAAGNPYSSTTGVYGQCWCIMQEPFTAANFVWSGDGWENASDCNQSCSHVCARMIHDNARFRDSVIGS